MHRLLRGYYSVGEQAFSALASKAVIVPDTNVLLDLYRVGEEAQADIFSVLEWAKDRLWVPFIVALEFLRNRQAVRAELISRLEKASRNLTEALDSVRQQLEHVRPRHSREVLQVALFEANNGSRSFLDTITSIAKDHSPASSDSVLERLEKILSSHVAEPMDKDALNMALKEAEQRFIDKVPPGYKDDDKKYAVRLGPVAYPGKYGDFLIWYEIRRHMKSSEKSLIF